MKALIGLLFLTSVAHARPHSLISCTPVKTGGLAANFAFDYFDDKYSKVTVFTDKKLLFKLNGDTRANPCLEVDMSAGADSAETLRDIIAVFTVHEMTNCEGPFNSVRLGASGKHSGNTVTGNLSVKHNGRYMDEKVKCSIKEMN